jgi:hypothetical protein
MIESAHDLKGNGCLLTIAVDTTCSLARYRWINWRIGVVDRFAAVAIKTKAPSGVMSGTNLAGLVFDLMLLRQRTGCSTHMIRFSALSTRLFTRVSNF